ncbi:hypothetical protein [Corynebacterium sp. 20_84]
MFEKLDPENQMKAARGEILRVVNEVNPELAELVDPNVSWIDQLKEHASRSELKAIREGIRPLAERSFDDPLARYMFRYLPGFGVKNPDISYVVDEIEQLKDEEIGPELQRGLDHDVDILYNTLLPSSVGQLDRFLRLESEAITLMQGGIIQEGAKKKFFREASELQWLVSSRFRGLNKYTDRALDRMLSASDESVSVKTAGSASPESEALGVETLADAAVSGPIPIYVSVPAEEYSALLSAEAEVRADAVFEAMEEETWPVGDVDKLHAATYRVLVDLVGEEDAEAIVYGGTDLDPQQETDGLRGNEAGVVDKLSSVLAGVELGAVENSYAVGELAAIYAAAAERGDAIAVLMN